MPSYADLVTIGRVVRPQGRKGELLTLPLTDRPDRFERLRAVYVPGPGGSARSVAVTSCWPHKGRYVVKIEGVDCISDAEAFRGVDLRLSEDELGPLPEGTYYLHQLRGLRAEAVDGVEIGSIADVMETGSTAVLVIRRGPEETLLPLCADFVERVDLAAGRIIVRLPRMEEGDAPR